MSEERGRGREMTYRDAGVDIDAQERALARIREHVASTATGGVLSELGAFGGLFALPDGIPDPVLVASTDGVGTKVLVAQRAGRHETIGQDLVNHCVNDILVMGARPLFFLDYFAVGRLDPLVAERVVAGVARACRENGCALLGGETAEMPDIYGESHYDLAGTIVGIVARDSVLDGTRVGEGDVLLALPSSGLHTNGYTLARRIVFERLELGPDDEMPGCQRSVSEVLLAVHRSYATLLADELRLGTCRALAHITGGGLPDNLPRVLPDGLAAEVVDGSWPVPPVFETLARAGEVPLDDMRRTFNMGVGMVIVASEADAPGIEQRLGDKGEPAYRIGRVVAARGGRPRVAFTGAAP